MTPFFLMHVSNYSIAEKLPFLLSQSNFQCRDCWFAPDQNPLPSLSTLSWRRLSSYFKISWVLSVSCVYSVNSKSAEPQRAPPFETGAGGGASANLNCQKKQSGKGVVIFFKACEDWVEGQWRRHLWALKENRWGFGAGRDITFDVVKRPASQSTSFRKGGVCRPQIGGLSDPVAWIRLRLSLIYTSGEEHFVCFWVIPLC